MLLSLIIEEKEKVPVPDRDVQAQRKKNQLQNRTANKRTTVQEEKRHQSGSLGRLRRSFTRIFPAAHQSEAVNNIFKDSSSRYNTLIEYTVVAFLPDLPGNNRDKRVCTTPGILVLFFSFF
jgi:hypothetical protein